LEQMVSADEKSGADDVKQKRQSDDDVNNDRLSQMEQLEQMERVEQVKSADEKSGADDVKQKRQSDVDVNNDRLSQMEQLEQMERVEQVKSADEKSGADDVKQKRQSDDDVNNDRLNHLLIKLLAAPEVTFLLLYQLSYFEILALFTRFSSVSSRGIIGLFYTHPCPYNVKKGYAMMFYSNSGVQYTVW